MCVKAGKNKGISENTEDNALMMLAEDEVISKIEQTYCGGTEKVGEM